MRKAATLMIYISSFATLVLMLFTLSVVLIVIYDFYLKFLSIVLFLWFVSAILTIRVIEKERKHARNKR